MKGSSELLLTCLLVCGPALRTDHRLGDRLGPQFTEDPGPVVGLRDDAAALRAVVLSPRARISSMWGARWRFGRRTEALRARVELRA